MKRLRHAVPAGIILLLGLFALLDVNCSPVPQAQEGGANASARPSENLCGFRALTCAAGLAGIRVDQKSILRELCIKPNGSSMWDLYQAAQRIGMQARPFRLEWSSLLKQQTPVILYLPHHFVVADPREQRIEKGKLEVRIYDLPNIGAWTGEADLCARWKGECITIQAAAPGQPIGPRLQADTLFEDFGTTVSTGIVTRLIRFRNVGSAPLRIAEVNKTCGCTEAMTDKDWYAPGESGCLSILIDLHGRQGRQEQVVTLVTNDDACSITSVLTRGMIINPTLASADQIDFGRIVPGSAAKASIQIQDRGDSRLRITLKEVRFATYCANLINPSSIQIAATPSGMANVQDVSFDLTVPPGTPLGRYAGMISLSTNYGEYPEIELPFDVQVSEAVSCDSDSISFGKISTSKPKSKSVDLLTHGAVDLSELSVTVAGMPGKAIPSGRIIRVAGKLVVQMTLPPCDSVGPDPQLVRGTMNLTLNRRVIQTIPWSYLI
jgi:hypothetical protein